MGDLSSSFKKIKKVFHIQFYSVIPSLASILSIFFLFFFEIWKKKKIVYCGLPHNTTCLSSQPKPFLLQTNKHSAALFCLRSKMSKFFRRTAVSASRRVRTAMATRPSPSTSRLSSSSSPSPVQATSSQRTTFLKQQRTQLLVSSSSAAHRNFRSRLYSINSHSPSQCLSLLFPCCFFFFYFCFFVVAISSFFFPRRFEPECAYCH